MINLSKLNIIGLTGMSGAGKSLAARVFADSGYCVIDCDKEARCVIAGEKCAEAVKSAFPEAYTNSGFDRIKMAQIVFSNKNKLKKYEEIVFPFIVFHIINIILSEAENVKNFLLDAPALYQSGADDFCRKIIAVVADRETCVKRITMRDNISEADAFLRIDSQPDAKYYKEKASYLIRNNNDSESFLKRVSEVTEVLK
ncbi:MAG: dephospho-CoA kinase [Oscillospiraceae bacterium]|jgi:dephospho-CoA kinase|nr:dephospho-CoA kinase [Oscillospiraceae bacterium]